MSAHLDQCQVFQIEPEEMVSVKREELFKLMDGFIFLFFGKEEEGETTDAHSWSLSDSTHALSLQNPS